jgi:hypothetical protein
MAIDEDSGSGPGSCPVLTGVSNYAIWRIRIIGKLGEAKVPGIVEGRVTASTMATSAATANIYPAATVSSAETFLEKDERAKGILMKYISDRLVLQLAHLTSAKAVFDEIVRIHETQNAGIRAFLLFTELTTTSWDPATTTIEDHVSKLRNASARLTAMGRPVSDEFLAFFLLASLPQDPFWDNFRTSVTQSVAPNTSLKFEDVDSRLQTQVIGIRGNIDGNSAGESALKATSSSRPFTPRTGSSTSSRTMKTCERHGQNTTHNTEQCRVLKREREEKEEKKKKKGKEKEKERAHSTSHDSDSDSDSVEEAHVTTLSNKLRSRIRLYLASDPSDKRYRRIADTGASCHITPLHEWFEPGSYQTLSPPRKIHFGDNSYAEATGMGTIILESKIGDETIDIELSDVLHVPTFSLTLISVNRLCRTGAHARFGSSRFDVRKGGKTILTGFHKRGLYHLDAVPHTFYDEAHASIDINVLHRRMGHRNFDDLIRMVKDGQLENIENVTGTPNFCEPCTLSKIRRIHLPEKSHRSARRPLQIIHSDVGGPVNVQSYLGHRYWITFVDEYTRFPWVYVLKKKSEAERVYTQWREDVQAHFGAEVGDIHLSSNFVEFFRTDNGGEYTSKTFEARLKKDGVIHETTAPDTPEQNGLAERFNATLANTAVAMLIDSKLPKKYWDEAILTAAYTIARSPASGLKKRTPYQALFKRHVDSSIMRPFGCNAYAFISHDKRDGKLSKKGRKCVFLGYQPGKKAYRLLDVKSRKVITSRHVVFNEGEGGERPPDLAPDAEPTEEQWEDFLSSLLRRSSVSPDDADTGRPRPGHAPGRPSADSDTDSDSDSDSDTEGAVGGQWERAPSPVSDHPRAPPNTPRNSRPGTRGSISPPPSDRKPPRDMLTTPSRIPTRTTAPTSSARPTPTRTSGTPSRIPRRPDQTPGPPVPPVPPTPVQPPFRRPDMPTPHAPQRGKAKGPAEKVAGIRRSTRDRVPADRDKEVRRTIEAEAQRLLRQHEQRGAARRGPGPGEAGPSTRPQETQSEPESPAETDENKAAENDDDSESGAAFEYDFAGMASDDTGPSRSYPLPANLREALNGPDADQWQEALAKELGEFDANEVYEEVPIPHGVKPITSKPVFRVKLDQNGNIERFKIRIVARGFTQQAGKDYDETFAPVANLESIRILLALANKYDLELDQMDVSTAYLNGEILEELYLAPPDGVQIKPGHCWRLKKSLYGLKQAGRTWNTTLDKALGDLGFARLDAETCLYVFRDKDGGLCYLVVYVDDLLLAATSRKLMDKVKSKLKSRFRMHDLGPASFILGLEIKRDRKNRKITLSQRQYIDKVLERCGMSECSPLSTPMSHSARVTADDPDDNTVVLEMVWNGKRVTYPMIVGSLMYAMLGTRPDLAYTVGVLGRYSASPKACHWALAKRALRYLKGTRDMVLVYDGADISIDLDFHGFTDADWSGDVDTSRSTSGYVFISTRGAIGWSSKRQSMVALSTTESEYIGLSNAGQHLAWLRTFFEDVGHAQTGPIELFCDNQAAIILSRDPQFRARSKHINRKFHFVRDDIIGKGQAVVRYVKTDDQVADIFTKALPKDKHWKFCKAMGLSLPGRTD